MSLFPKEETEVLTVSAVSELNLSLKRLKDLMSEYVTMSLL